MATLSAGASASFTLTAGNQISGVGAGTAVIGRAGTVQALTAGDAWRIGPYLTAQTVSITSTSAMVYEQVAQVSADPSPADLGLTAAQVPAIAALVSEDWIPQRETVMPDEVVRMAATGGVCGSPCYVSRIRCVTGTAVALTVYEGAASTATTLLTATLSAGEEATIPGGRLRAINGVRAVFASGSFDFSIGTEG